MDEDGFAVIPNLLTAEEANQLAISLEPVLGAGRRGLLEVPLVSGLARSGEIRKLLKPHLPGPPRPVRAIYFDKSNETNWSVPWHQDLTIAVCQRASLPGFGPWTIKQGIPHVQPPVQFLEQMLTVRIHLDQCNEANGALQVLAGTHRLGRLDSEQIGQLRGSKDVFVCSASAGDVLLMRPLLLHSSSRLKIPGHRRVLHIEYAGFDLPAPLRWHEAA